MYHAIGFWSELDNGMEISMGFDKSMLKLLIEAFIILTAKSAKVYTRFAKILKIIDYSFYSVLYQVNIKIYEHAKFTVC